jgi:hypothetical protein
VARQARQCGLKGDRRISGVVESVAGDLYEVGVERNLGGQSDDSLYGLERGAGRNLVMGLVRDSNYRCAEHGG